MQDWNGQAEGRAGGKNLNSQVFGCPMPLCVVEGRNVAQGVKKIDERRFNQVFDFGKPEAFGTLRKETTGLPLYLIQL